MGNNKKNILILLLFLFTISFNLVSQTKGIPIVRLFDKEYYKYEIKSKETVFSICKRFNVTEAELVSMNPFITNGLQSGQKLMIPVKTESKPDKTESKPDKKEVLIEGNNNIKAITKEYKPKKTIFLSTDKPRVTIILPFEPTGTGVNERYVEFYEGFLLAVDSLKNLGLSFEVQTIESGNGAEGIKNAILNGQLDETDYCIGGVNPEQITLLADWAKKNQKFLIIPFSTRIPELNSNPWLFQTNTPHNYTYNHFSEYMVSHFKNSNLIFLNSASDKSNISTTLIPLIKTRLKKANKTYTEVNYDEFLVSLYKVLADNRENVILPSPFTLSKTNQFVTRLSDYVKNNPKKMITLIGYPDWQTMNSTYQKKLYKLNTYIYSNFYANYQKKNVSDFQIQFSRTFGKNLLNTFPKYSMIGYDVATYFIPKMVYEKTENVESVIEINPLQNKYQFGDKKTLSGLFNKITYIIHYAPNDTVEVKTLY